MNTYKDIYIFILFSLFSCNNSDTTRLELIRLKSEPIKLMEENQQLFFNEKENCIPNSENKLHMKLIVYHDSISCTSCIIDKLYIWDDIINYSKETRGKLKLYFIFCPSKDGYNVLKLSFKHNLIGYPILIDRNGDFERLNPHLPKNKAMHTFLLDENNKVILVGNPLHNKEIEKLFYKKTQELLSK